MRNSGPLQQLLAYITARISVDKNGCWIYPTVNEGGYGQVVWILGAHPTKYMTHRIVYTVSKGPIPEGYEIDHLCCVRACCNPAHLEAVTPSENKRRIVLRNAGRMAYPNGVKPKPRRGK